MIFFQYVQAKDAYQHLLHDNPKHAKALQRLGWLYHQDGSSFKNQDLAIEYLTNSLESGKRSPLCVEFTSSSDNIDSNDAESWHLLGRVYMACQENLKAFEAYQQAVYRDGRNLTFWCSLGALYFQFNQYRDARDMYGRAADLDPNNPAIAEQIQLLRSAQGNGVQDDA